MGEFKHVIGRGGGGHIWSDFCCALRRDCAKQYFYLWNAKQIGVICTGFQGFRFIASYSNHVENNLVYKKCTSPQTVTTILVTADFDISVLQRSGKPCFHMVTTCSYTCAVGHY